METEAIQDSNHAADGTTTATTGHHGHQHGPDGRCHQCESGIVMALLLVVVVAVMMMMMERRKKNRQPPAEPPEREGSAAESTGGKEDS